MATETTATDLTAEVQRRDQRIADLERELASSQVETEINDAIIAAGGDTFGLRPHIAPSVRAFPDATRPGKFVVRVIDPSQPDKPLRHPNGSFKTPADLLVPLKADPMISRLFGLPGQSSGESEQGVRRLTAQEARDPKLYRRLKEDVKAGRLRRVVDANGRRIL